MARKKSRAQQDLELWQVYKAEPSTDNLVPLLTALQPVIMKRVNTFAAAPVPRAAVIAEAHTAAKKAIDTYSPGKGTQLNSWVTTQLQKVQSAVIKHQNVGRIPDRRVNRIRDFENAKLELTARLGHEPDAVSMADYLKWSPAEIGRLEAELGRADLVASRNLESDLLQEAGTSAEREVLRYIHYDLDPQERAVFEYSLGLYGKQKLPAKAIASRLGISQPKVSRIRKRINTKIESRLEARGF